MNVLVYDAAVRAGCPAREARTLATYVESEKIAVAAYTLGISQSTAEEHLSQIYRRLGVRHASAAVAKLLTAA